MTDIDKLLDNVEMEINLHILKGTLPPLGFVHVLRSESNESKITFLHGPAALGWVQHHTAIATAILDALKLPPKTTPDEVRTKLVEMLAEIDSLTQGN
jgi:hypothetical protein